MGYWVVGFGLNALRLAFYYLQPAVSLEAATIVAESVQASQSFFIVAGALAFVGKVPSLRAVFLGCLLSTIWAAAATLLHAGFLLFTVPLYGITGTAIVYSGGLLLTQAKDKAAESRFIGWALVLWGIHKWNFPFLRPVEWFAPWGFLIAQGLSVAVAIGVIIFVMRSLQRAVIEESNRRQIADKALADREQVYRSVIETAHDGFWIANQTGMIEEVNQAYLNRSGYGRDELIGKNVSEIDVVDSEAEVEVRIQRILASGSDLFVTRHRAKSGEIWDVEIGVSCARTGTRMRFFCFARDITDRIRNERIVLANERRLRKILEDVPLISISLDPEGRIVFANDRFLTLTGWRREEIIGKDWFETVLPADIRREIGNMFRESVARGDVGSYKTNENEILTRDGTRLLISWYNVVSKNPDDSIHNITSLGRDVTEHQRNEQALKESEERYRRLYRELPQPYQSLDENGCFLEVNDAWCQLLGYEREEVIGRWFGSFLPESNRPAFERNFPRFKAVGHIHIDGYELVAKDGTKRVASFDGKVAHRPDGTFLQTHCILADVTERRTLEQKLAQAQKMEAVGQLTGGVAHDFNNLLQVIETNLELAREAIQGVLPNAADMIDAALNSERRGAELTQKLLAFSRKQTLRPRRLCVRDWLAGETRLLSRTLGEDIEIRTETPEDDVLIDVDESTLTNALLNIAINGRAAMPLGGMLTLSTSRRHFADGIAIENDTLPPGDYIEIAVSDTGVGMSEETLRRAFEPFFTTKDVGEGSGLGLSMVYGFARQSGGTVTIESELGKGTTVRIWLPAATDAAVEIESDGPGATATRHALKVLLVEDDADVRTSTVMLLMAIGCEVIETDKAAPVADILRRDDGIDLLISDVVLPGGVNGVEVAREAVAFRPDLKVILVSGYPDSTLAKSGFSEANFFLLPKPFSKAALSKAIALVTGEKI